MQEKGYASCYFGISSLKINHKLGPSEKAFLTKSAKLMFEVQNKNHKYLQVLQHKEYYPMASAECVIVFEWAFNKLEEDALEMHHQGTGS